MMSYEDPDEDYEDDEDYENEDYEDEEYIATLQNSPDPATKFPASPTALMMAGIGREVSSTRSGGGAVKQKIWILSNDVAAIFEADDRGDAVFAINRAALLEGLEEKFPAPPGFSCFDSAAARIVQYEYPIANYGTSWEEIISIAKGDDHKCLLVPEQIGLPPGAYASYPSGGDVELANQFSARYAIDDEVYVAQEHRFRNYFLVYYDPKTAKKLQGYRKQSEKRQSQQQEDIAAGIVPETIRRNTRQQVPAYSRCNFRMWQLRQLHKAFSQAALSSFEDCQIKTSVQINAYNITNEDGSPVKDSQRTKHRRIQLVRHITELRKLCIRLKRKWRYDPNEHGADRSDGYAGNLLNSFYPYTKALLKSKNEDYVVFGKWLRTEKRIADKQARIRAAEAETAAAKLQEEQEDQPLLGVRRKPKDSPEPEIEPETSTPPEPLPIRVVAATPKMPEHFDIKAQVHEEQIKREKEREDKRQAAKAAKAANHS